MAEFVNFRLVNDTTRLKMKLRDPHALQKLEDAEHRGGAVWFDRRFFAGALDHMQPETPTGSGQIIRLK